MQALHNVSKADYHSRHLSGLCQEVTDSTRQKRHAHKLVLSRATLVELSDGRLQHLPAARLALGLPTPGSDSCTPGSLTPDISFVVKELTILFVTWTDT